MYVIKRTGTHGTIEVIGFLVKKTWNSSYWGTLGDAKRFRTREQAEKVVAKLPTKDNYFIIEV